MGFGEDVGEDQYNSLSCSGICGAIVLYLSLTAYTIYFLSFGEEFAQAFEFEENYKQIIIISTIGIFMTVLVGCCLSADENAPSKVVGCLGFATGGLYFTLLVFCCAYANQIWRDLHPLGVNTLPESELQRTAVVEILALFSECCRWSDETSLLCAAREDETPCIRDEDLDLFATQREDIGGRDSTVCRWLKHNGALFYPFGEGVLEKCNDIENFGPEAFGFIKYQMFNIAMLGIMLGFYLCFGCCCIGVTKCTQPED